MSLYIGNLAGNVDNLLLKELIEQLAPVKHIKIHKNAHKQYAFVDFHCPEDHEYVRNILSSTPLKIYGLSPKIGEAHATTTAEVQLYIKIKDTSPTHLRNTLSKFGDVEVKVHHNHAVASFKDKSAAESAIKNLNHQFINGHQVELDFYR